jgi:SAM-dependent methyltransferase
MRLHKLEALEYEPPFSSDLMQTLGLRGIQFGPNKNLRRGWLNTDMVPLRTPEGAAEVGRLSRYAGDVYYLRQEATDPFPIEDGSFDWAYSEAMLQHLTPGEAVDWLSEVRRLLRPSGHLRLSCPDLRRFVRGYLDPDDDFLERHHSKIAGYFLDTYIQAGADAPPRRLKFRDDYFPGETEAPKRPAFMINQLFYLWGPKSGWIYDLEEVRHVAMLAGFDPEAVAERSFRTGREPEVCALDLAHRREESLYVELERT